MKILYIHQYFNTPDMPGSTRSYEFAKRLVSNGDTVYIITSNWQKKSNSFYSLEDGIKVYWGSMEYSNKMSFFRRISSFIAFIFYVFKIGLKLDYELIIASSTPLTVGIPALILKKIKKTKFLFEVRDVWPQIPIALGVIRSKAVIFLMKKLEKKIYSESDSIIALSDGMKREIEKSSPKSKKVNVVTNLCDINSFSLSEQVGINYKRNFLNINNEPIITYAGAFGRINNAAYLVDIAYEARSLDKKINFILAGNGFQRDLIKKRAEKLRVLNKNLFLFDYLPKKELPIFLSASTIISSLFIDLPEMENNSANKFFDGLAAGKPIMINYGGWQSKLINEHGSGFNIPNNNPKKAIKIISRIIFDKKKINEMSKSSKNLAYSFSIEKNFKTFKKAIDEINWDNN